MTTALTAERLVEAFLGRPASEPEIRAMSEQMERAAALVASHPSGRGGALFAIEPAHFETTLLAGRRA